METTDVYYGTKEFLQQIYLMWCKVIEIASSSDVTLYSPWEVGAVVVKVTWWNGETYLYIDNFANGTFRD